MEQAYKGEVMCVCGGGIYVNLFKKKQAMIFGMNHYSDM
jgi:hypothetical protein